MQTVLIVWEETDTEARFFTPTVTDEEFEELKSLNLKYINYERTTRADTDELLKVQAKFYVYDAEEEIRDWFPGFTQEQIDDVKRTAGSWLEVEVKSGQPLPQCTTVFQMGFVF